MQSFIGLALLVPEITRGSLKTPLGPLNRVARPIFLGLKFGQILFFWAGKFFSYISGFRKISAIFLGSDKFPAIFWGIPILYHTFESFE